MATNGASIGHSEDERVAAMVSDKSLVTMARDFMRESGKYGYTYNFSWLGRPVIQFPQDLIAIQELIWQLQPRFIIETGVAHGGGAIFYASILELIGLPAEVIAIDVALRTENRDAILNHPLSRRLHLVDGSSTDESVVKYVTDRVTSQGRSGRPVFVILDSNHTHEHVLAELKAYSTLVAPGGYIIVLDTSLEFLPAGYFPNRSWGPGNSPLTAVREFLEHNSRFAIDSHISDKLLITVAHDGFLRCFNE